MAEISFASEKELEDWICNHLDTYMLNPINDEVITSYQRQYQLAQYGVVDIITAHLNEGVDLAFNLIELKKEVINKDAIAQVSRYLRAFNRYIETFDPNDFGVKYIYAHATLSAPRLSTSDDTCYLIDSLDDVSFYKVEFDVDSGISFDYQSGWYHVDESFDSSSDQFLSDIRNNKSRNKIKLVKEVDG